MVVSTNPHYDSIPSIWPHDAIDVGSSTLAKQHGELRCNKRFVTTAF